MITGKVMVDSNIILDILEEDSAWFDWSRREIERLSDTCQLVINPVIYAEVSVGFKKIEEVEAALPHTFFIREPIPWEAAFLAGKSFLRYRKAGGIRKSTLPDFFIGAHALVGGMVLVSRDAGRYQSYFPALKLIAPSRQR